MYVSSLNDDWALSQIIINPLLDLIDKKTLSLHHN